MIDLRVLRLDSHFNEIQLSFLLLLALPLLYFLYPSSSSTANAQKSKGDSSESETKTVMQPESPDLLPPKDDPFTLEQLKAFDGSDESKPIYVAIKGDVFDVTRKAEVYGAGKSYNIFAGKDGSKGLGMSSLKSEDAVPDWRLLPDDEKKVLNDWHAFFSKRYNIVGKVSNLPYAVDSTEVTGNQPRFKL